ncbi:MAG: SRPBCC domain-containing protein [Alphaproteobacteria bacterium]|nr:SRPBCC domain-containing protein [Alphaproteobacteria bacterium]
MTAPLLAPVAKSLVVARSVDDAFRLYTQDIAKWWPTRTHSLGGDKVAAVVMEGRIGGRIFERWQSGSEKLWGTILAWDAPQRVVHTWHVATDPEHSSEIELRFVALGANRTRVTLEQRNWERMSGERAADIRGNYNSGWESVFIGTFGGYAGQGRDT